MLDENTFKSTYQIIKEISQVWSTLTDTTRANVTSLIAGKRNANVVQALMTNFEDAENAMQTAMDSAGSALMENEKYLDSIAGKLDLLKAQWESFAQSVIGSGPVKVVADLARVVLELATALSKVHLLLPLIAMGINIIVGRGLAKDVAKITASMQMMMGAGTETAAIMNAVSGSVAAMSVQQKKLLIDNLNQIAANEALSQSYRDQAAALAAAIAAQSGMAAANQGLAMSFKTLMASIPVWGWIALAVSTVISVLQTAIPLFSQAKEEAIEAANETIAAYDDAEKSYRSNTETLNGLKDRFNELSRGVGENGENVSLTAKEYEEYQNLLQQIIDISPGVVIAYDEQGNRIINYANALQTAIEKQDEFIQRQREIYLGKGTDVFEGKKNQYDAAALELVEESTNITDWLRVTEGASEAYLRAIEKIGIQNPFDAFAAATDSENQIDALITLYKRAKDVVNEMQAAGIDNIEGLENAVYRMAGAYGQLNAIIGEQVDMVMRTFQYSDSASYSFYKNIPVDALDEFKDGLYGVVDAEKSYNENMALASAYGSEFLQAIRSDQVGIIREMARGLKDSEGDINEELAAYNAAVNAFIDGWEGSPEVLAAIVNYLNSLSDSAQRAAPALEEAEAKFVGLKDAVDQLKKGYDALSKAQSEMDETGAISADTFSTLEGLMEDGEDVADYLYVENGMLKLNVEAWKARSNAMAEGNIAAIQSRIAELQQENSILIGEARANPEDAKAASDRIAQNSAEIKKQNALLQIQRYLFGAVADESETITAAGTFENLSKVQSEVSDVIKALDTLRGGEQVDLFELAVKHPELMDIEGLFDIDTISGKEAALKGILEQAEKDYDAYIDTQLNALRAARDEADEGEIASIDTQIANWEKLKSFVLEELYGEDVSIKVGFDFEAESDGFDAMLDAIKSSVSGLGMNEEQVNKLTDRYKELESFDPAKLYSRTSLGINVNTKALRELESAYEDQKHLGLQATIDEQSEAYTELTRRIIAANGAERDALVEERSGIYRNIQLLKDEQSQFAALTSTFNKWKQAQSLGEEGDMYDDFADGLENIKELYEEGLIGTNKFKAAIELMTGENADQMTSDQLVAAYEKAYPIMQKYFEDGATGTETFLEDLERLSDGKWAKKGADGTWNIDVPIQEAADKLGISADLVEVMLRKLRDYNFDIDLTGFGEGIDKFAGDTDTALDEIAKSKQELDRQFESGNLSTQEYVDAWEVLDRYEQKLKEIKGVAGESTEAEPLSIDEAIEQIDALKTTIDTLESAGIEVPVQLTGDYETLTALLEDLGGDVSGNGDGGSLQFTINAQQAEEKIMEIETDLQRLRESPTIGTDITATLISAGDMTIEQLRWISETEFPQGKGFDITVTVNDGDANEKLDAVTEKANTGATCNVTIDGNDEGWTSTITRVRDDAATGATCTVTINAADEEVSKALARYASIVTPTKVLVTDSGTAASISQKLDDAAKPDGDNREAIIDAAAGPGIGEIESTLNGIATPESGARQAVYGATGDETIAEVDAELTRIATGDRYAHYVATDDGTVDDEKKRMDDAATDRDVAFKADDGGTANKVGDAFDKVADKKRVATITLRYQEENKPDVSPDSNSRDTGALDAVMSMDTLKNGAADAVGALKTAANQFGSGASLESVQQLDQALKGLLDTMDAVSAADPLDADASAEAASQLQGAASAFTEAYTKLYGEMEAYGTNVDAIEVDADVSNALATIATMAVPDAEVKFYPNSDAVEAYIPADKIADVDYRADFTKVTTATAPTLKGVVEYQRKITGPAQANGTAFASGALSKNGRLTKDVDALAGELGTEMYVRDGEYHTVGDDGAEFFHFKRGDIIFNADQTEELLKYGKVKSGGGRGHLVGVGNALVDGTAFADPRRRGLGYTDTATGTGKLPTTKSTATKKRSSKSGSQSKSTSDDGSDKFDWIEIAIARIESAIDRLGKTASSAFAKITTRLSAMGKEAKKVREEIELQEKGAKRYLQEAEKVDLSADLKKRVREGAIDINEYDDDVQQKIQEYQKWYEKMLQCQEAAKDLRTRLVEIAAERFDALEKHFDGLLDKIDHALTMTDKRRELAKYTGGGLGYDKATKKSYNKEAKQLDKQYATQAKKLQKLQAEQKAFLEAGGKKGSEKYREMQAAIEGVEEAMIDTEIAQRELLKERFDAIGEQYDRRLELEKHTQSVMQSDLDMMRYAGGDQQGQYDKLMGAQSDSIEIQRKKLSALIKSRDQALATGKIKEGSQAWYEMQSAINEADEALRQMSLDMEQMRVDAFSAAKEAGERIAQRHEHTIRTIENELEDSKFTTAGSEDVYARRIQAQNDDIEIQKKNLEGLRAAREKAMEGPDGIKEGSAAWHEMTSEIEAAEEQLQKSFTDVKQLYVDAFDAIQREFESHISAIDSSLSMAEARIADAQYTGVDKAGFYQSMLDDNRAKYKQQRAELAALEEKQAEALANGVEYGSEEWRKLQSQIDSVKVSIQKTQTEIRAIYKEAFDDIEDEYSKRMSTLDHIRKTYENENTASRYTGADKRIDALIATERMRISELYAERAELQQKMDEAANAADGIDRMSDAWLDMEQSIDKVDEAIQEATISIYELFGQGFSDIQGAFDGALGLIGSITSIVESDLSELEKRGRIGGENMYRQLMSIEEANIRALKNEQEALEQAMQAALDTGMIREYSEAWYEQKSAIDSVAASIRDAELKTIDYANAIRQIQWDVFDRTRDSVSELTDEAEFLISLMENSKLFDDNGRMTDTGAATAGLLGMRYDVAMAQADAYADEIKSINAELAKDPNNTKLIDRRQELLGLQRDAILAAEDEKQAVRSLIEEGFNAELEALQKRISAYDDSLDQAKDLYDYQKNIAEQTRAVASLQKQVSAYSGDNSEENKARMQRLTVDLSEAQEQLAETQYEHYISDQKKLLDELYDEYERLLNERLDDVDALMRDIIAIANNNTAQIISTLEAETGKVGIGVSDAIESVWRDGAQPALAMYMSELPQQMTGVSNAVSSIEKNVKSIVDTSISAIGNDVNLAANGISVAAEKASSILEQLQSEDGIKSNTARSTSTLANILTTVQDVGESNAAQLTELQTLVASNNATNGSIAYGVAAVGTSGDNVRGAIASATNDVISMLNNAAYSVRSALNENATIMNLTGNGVATKVKDSVYYWGDRLYGVLTAIKTIGLDIAGSASTSSPRTGTTVSGVSASTNRVGGFAKGGFIAELKKAAVRNGDNLVTINTLQEGEAVFTADEFRKIDSLVDAIPELMSIVDINRFMAPALSRANGSGSNGGIDIGGVNIQIERVQDYNDFVRQLRDDKSFERMIGAMTIDRMTGGSSLAKKKYYN